MFRSRRAGSRSMSVACDSSTNAPDAGFSSMSASSSGRKAPPSAMNSSASAKAMPPARTILRRSHASPSRPSGGSRMQPKMYGTAVRRPTWTYERPRSVRIRGQAAVHAPATSSSRSSTSSRTAAGTIRRWRRHQGIRIDEIPGLMVLPVHVRRRYRTRRRVRGFHRASAARPRREPRLHASGEARPRLARFTAPGLHTPPRRCQGSRAGRAVPCARRLHRR